jgi:hypothetical protein
MSILLLPTDFFLPLEFAPVPLCASLGFGSADFEGNPGECLIDDAWWKPELLGQVLQGSQP